MSQEVPEQLNSSFEIILHTSEDSLIAPEFIQQVTKPDTTQPNEEDTFPSMSRSDTTDGDNFRNANTDASPDHVEPTNMELALQLEETVFAINALKRHQREIVNIMVRRKIPWSVIGAAPKPLNKQHTLGGARKTKRNP